jgi:glutaminyl-tRNA synthetase
VEVRLYDRLFTVEDVSTIDGDFRDHLNPKSLTVRTVYAEPELAKATTGMSFQFLRMGYYCLDQDSTPGTLIFNQTVTLRDMWAKGKLTTNN